MTTAVVFGYGDVGIRCLATLLAQGVTVPRGPAPAGCCPAYHRAKRLDRRCRE